MEIGKVLGAEDLKFVKVVAFDNCPHELSFKEISFWNRRKGLSFSMAGEWQVRIDHCTDPVVSGKISLQCSRLISFAAGSLAIYSKCMGNCSAFNP